MAHGVANAQSRMLSLNSKFAPRPSKTTTESIVASFDDFTLRVRLSEKARKARALRGIQNGPDLEPDGQPKFVPKFHIPRPEATGPPLYTHVEMAFTAARQFCIDSVEQQCLQVKPNLDAKEFDKLLKLLETCSVIAVPSDKNLGLCLGTAEWYYEQAWKLLLNPSYLEDEPDHLLL